MARYTLGVCIKDKLDDKLLGQHFRDKNRYFKVDEFKFAVMPIIETLMDDEELETSMYTKKEMFRLAVDIGKKRDFYRPKKKVKLNPTKKRRMKARKIKKKCMLLLLLLLLLLPPPLMLLTVVLPIVLPMMMLVSRSL